MVHLVDEYRLLFVVVGYHVEPPLQEAERKALTLLFCHKISQLVLIVDAVYSRAESLDR